MSELRRFAVEDGSDITKLVSGLQQRASFRRDPDQVVERTVYDTFDWRLHAERTILEHDRVVLPPRSRRVAPEPWLVWRSSDTGEVLGRLAVGRCRRSPGTCPTCPPPSGWPRWWRCGRCAPW